MKEKAHVIFKFKIFELFKFKKGTEEGLEKIFKIKSSMNTGRSYK